MAYDEFLLTRKDGSTFIDGIVMGEMPDDDYRKYVRNSVLFVDHHDHLRFEGTGQIIATNLEQFNILADELMTLREKMVSREGEPDVEIARKMMPDRRDGFE